jgi:serine/threonine protein kinase
MIGKMLAHFEILAPIGAGGMGEVYRARDTKLERDVALKTLPPEVAADPMRRKRFLNEARAVAALNHPNIVTIFSVEEDAGLHFLTMELIEGQPLGAVISESGLALERFLDIALPLTDALSAAHDLGVVHRDLKPSNVMLTENGRPKILDFGLATFVKPDESAAQPAEASSESALSTRTQITGEGTIVGTMPYMSPEQIEAKPVDVRSDVFSLGIILYEMATGRRPFHGDTGPSLMSSILKDVPPPVMHLNPQLPGDLGRIISRCLEKEPDRRFRSAREVNRDLDALKHLMAASAAAAGTSSAGLAAPDPQSISSPGAGSPRGAHFEHDIFISYAQLDNEAQLAGQEGWVSAFHRSLEVRVGQLLGKKPNIWRDPKLSGNDDLEEAQFKHIPSSALILTVLSPRYLKSEWCAKELQAFLNASVQTGGPKWGAKYRVFKVVKTPTPVERHPPQIQALLGYEFYKVDPETGRTRELNQIFGPEAQRDYWARLDDLAHDLVELLEKVEPGSETVDLSDPGARVMSVSSEPSKGVIYLAHTSHDLKEEHDVLRRDLQRHGYQILPAQPLPLVESELREFVRAGLARARMSIHLVGQNYGIVPEGATDSMVALQNSLAMERAAHGGFNRLVWIPEGLQTTDARQQEFITRLRNDPGTQEGSDLLETPLEDLKTVVHQILNPPVRASEPRVRESDDTEITHIYLICDQRDQDSASPLADCLFERGYEVTLPVFEGDEAEIREDHEENLRQCDAVLIYYGAGNELWLRRKLREIQKSAGLGRSRKMRAKGIWVAQPVTAQKGRLKTREAAVMTAPESFSPEPLQPFLTALAGAAGR